MVAQPSHPYTTVAEYLQLDRDSLDTRYEYIDGHMYMLAGGTANHSTISINVTGVLRDLLRGTQCRVYNSDMRVRLAETRYVYPDASVSCDERDRGKANNVCTPLVVVEILSPSTTIYDRGQKFALYRECSAIQEYMIIDAERPLIEIFTRDKEDLWLFRASGIKGTIQLNSLDISFPTSLLYENVVFIEEEEQ